MNIFRHEKLGQRKGGCAGIVNDMRGVEYTPLKWIKVGARSEQPCVSSHNGFSYLEKFIEPQHYHKEVSYTPGVAKMLYVQCPIIL